MFFSVGSAKFLAAPSLHEPRKNPLKMSLIQKLRLCLKNKNHLIKEANHLFLLLALSPGEKKPTLKSSKVGRSIWRLLCWFELHSKHKWILFAQDDFLSFSIIFAKFYGKLTLANDSDCFSSGHPQAVVSAAIQHFQNAVTETHQSTFKTGFLYNYMM